MFCSACGSRLAHAPPIACRACGTGHWLDAKPCAGALVVHGGRLLLVRRKLPPWRGHWDVPGGFCGAAEHPIATAERELLEETGLAVRVTGLLGMWLDAYDDPSREAPKMTLNIYYHAVPVGEASVTPDGIEVGDARWFAADTLPRRLAFPRHVAAVLDAWRRAVLAGETRTPLPDRPK